MLVLNIIGLVILFLSLVSYWIVEIKSKKNKIKLKKEKNSSHNFCILVPARDESLVIRDLLESIKKQTHKIDFKDVYVIVEDKKDPTVNICNEYQASVFIRKKLDLQRKGYAIDEAVKDILKKGLKYDAYFIMDADNVMDKNFIKNMIKSYDKGYDIAIGYRALKNNNDNLIAGCSILTFTMVNDLTNEKKTLLGETVTLSGTGFYIKGSLIDKWQGFPFHELTEDYELSMYATVNDLSTCYNKKAYFYDEQPTKYRVTINQRIRWIKGFFTTRKKYIPKLKEKYIKDKSSSAYREIVGVTPVITLIISLVILIISVLISKRYIGLIILLGGLYLMIALFTLILLLIEGENLKIAKKAYLKISLFNFFYLLGYVYAAIVAVAKKEVKWTKIEHGNYK